jgi:hypothetical protein
VRHRTGRLGIRIAIDELGARRSCGPTLPDGSERIYLHHVRKTGGTSLVRSFLGLGGEDPLAVERRIADSYFSRTQSNGLVFVSGHKELVNRGHYFFAFSHNPAHEIHLPDRTFTITVLRDPLQRVLSYYKYLKAGDGPDIAIRVGERERQMAADGLDSFLKRVPKQQFLRQLYTFSPTYDVGEAEAAIRRCSVVISSERHSDGVQSLATKLDLKLNPRRDRVTRHSDDPMDPPTMSRIRELLEPEYELLHLLRDAFLTC